MLLRKFILITVLVHLAILTFPMYNAAGSPCALSFIYLCTTVFLPSVFMVPTPVASDCVIQSRSEKSKDITCLQFLELPPYEWLLALLHVS